MYIVKRRVMSLFLGALCAAGIAACAGRDGDVQQTNVSNRVESLKSIGDVHLREGRYRAALQQYMEADTLDPKNPEVKFRIGLVYGDFFKRLEDAIRYYTEAIQLKRDYSEAYNNLGTVYARQQRWDEAIAMFNKALENLYYATPERAYQNLGQAYDAKGDSVKALDYYHTAIELKPQYVDPYIQVGLIHQAADRQVEAVQAFQQARAILEKREPRKGRGSEAEGSAYRTTLGGVYYHLGRSLAKLGKVAEARDALQKAVDLFPDEAMQRQAQSEIQGLPVP